MSNSKAKTEAPQAHAKHGPSSLYYKEICPGWTNTKSDSPAAAEGTMMHHAAETRDLSKLTEEQASSVEMCLGYVDELIHEFPKKPRVFLESRLVIPYSEFGTADVVIVDSRGESEDKDPWARSAHVIDYKFGRNAVPDASENPQGFAYALGVFDKFPWVEKLEVHFLLPRRDEVSRHTFYRSKDYNKMLLRIATIVGRANAPEEEKELNPHEIACLYCARKDTGCRALNQFALQIAPKYDPLAELPDMLHGSEITDPNQMSVALKLAPIMEAWAAGVKKAGLEMRLNDGIEVPGFELVARRNPRKIENSTIAYEIFSKMGGTLEEFVEECQIPMTKLEEILAKKAKKGHKEKVRQEFEDRLVEASALSLGTPSYHLRKVKT